MGKKKTWLWKELMGAGMIGLGVIGCFLPVIPGILFVIIGVTLLSGKTGNKRRIK